MTIFYRATFWAALTFAFVMALLPRPPQMPGAPSDKIQHIAAFATLALLATVAYRSTSLIRLFAGLAVFGALIELFQAIPALNRDSDPLDWVADVVAAAAVFALVRCWRSSGAADRDAA